MQLVEHPSVFLSDTELALIEQAKEESIMVARTFYKVRSIMCCVHVILDRVNVGSFHR